MKERIVYSCEGCAREGTDRAEIAACDAIPMRMPDVKIGDVVRGDQAYGWWSADREWFLEERGDPKSDSHHVRAQLGYPLFVVLALAKHCVVFPGSIGDYAHRYDAILFSPRYANTVSKVLLTAGYASRDAVRTLPAHAVAALTRQAIASDSNSRLVRILRGD